MSTQTLEPDTEDDQADETADWEPESAGRRVQRSVYATVWRCRRQVAPHAITAGVLGAGVAAEAVAAAGSSPAGLSAILAGVGFPLAAAVAQQTRRRRPRWARRALIGGLTAAGWLTTAPFGVGLEQTALLVGVEYALAARWWQVNRPGYPNPDATTPATVDEPVSTAGQVIMDWREFVGSQGGPLPGSSLSLPAPTRHGYAFTLQLSRGKQTITGARNALDKISTGLEYDVASLIVEAFPPDPATGKTPTSRCRLQVITDSPIRGDVMFDGPRRRNGLLDIGPYADGNGEAPWRLYSEDSMWGGVIIGKTRSGKSRVAENLAISALSGGDTVIWFLDPQYGASSPALAKVADWCVSQDGADDMLQAALAIGDARGRENSLERIQGFTPSPERPGLLIFVDECHRVFQDPAAAKQWAFIARELRKVGVVIVCLSQYIGLETFGGSEPLRGGVMAGNAMCMKVNSANGQQLMAGLTVNPLFLPDIPGYGYTVGSEETGIRTAPFRNRLVNKGDAEGWLEAQPRPPLDMLAQTATLIAGTAYRDRHAATEDGREESRAFVEALRGGHLPAGVLVGSATKTHTAEVAGEMGVVIQFPRGITPEDLQRPAYTSRPGTPAGVLTGSRKQVYDAVAAGATRPTEVEERVDLGPRRVADILKDLVESGHLIQPRYGRYQRAAA